jgi:hypothetical protein
MGLSLARIGEVVSHPASRAAMGFVASTTLVGGTLLATRYAYDDGFRQHAGFNNPISWEYGIPSVAGVAATATGLILARPGQYRDAWQGGMLLAGAGLGVAAGVLLAEPLVHGALVDQ